jgi:hypothetical protein
MARQKCVMNAMLHQLSPQTVVLKFEKIANASKALISTNIPRSEIDHFVSLALKARSQPVRTVSFVPPMIDTAHPDIAKIRRTVQNAIHPKKRVKGAASTKAGSGTKSTGGVMTGGAYGSLHTGYAANQAANLGSAC